MQRFTIRSLVFLSGLLLAIGVERARVTTPRQLPQNASKNTAEQGRAMPPLPQAHIAPAILPSESKLKEVLPAPTISREEILKAVQSAAREGSSRALERLNGKTLSSLPEYHQEVLPILKKETLQVLLRRFSESDWTDWPRASFVLEGNPTPARTYVNDVFIVNEDLGRFLETAALLLYVSYASAAEGKIIQPEKALERVFSQADRLLAYRTPKAIPARELLDPEILSLPFVRDRMKQIQSGLVMRYVRAHPNDYTLLFDLLSQLPNETISSEVNDALADLLQRFSLEASAPFRQEILDKILSGHSIADRSRSDARVARSLAHLFLMGVVDSLDVGDMRRADLYLDESYSFDPHLPAQDMVAEAIREANGKALLKSKEKKVAPADELGLEEAAVKPKKGADDSAFDLLASKPSKDAKSQTTVLEKIVAFLFSALVLLLVLGGGTLYILYRRGLKAAGPLEDDMNGPRSKDKISATSATDVPFGDDSPTNPVAARAQLRAAATGG